MCLDAARGDLYPDASSLQAADGYGIINRICNRVLWEQTVSISLSQYVLYLQYLAVGIVMVVVFAAVYLRCTPAAELHLIKEGNLACALSFGGALVGFCLPLATSIANNIHLLDFMLWGAAAAVIQIIVYFAATRLVPDASGELAANNVAVGTLCAAVSVSVGLLNAACLVG